MKSLIALTFVLAFVGLAQPALHSTRRLRGEESPPFLSRNIIQDFFEAIPKSTWYQNGLWFINKILNEKMKTSELKDRAIRLYSFKRPLRNNRVYVKTKN